MSVFHPYLPFLRCILLVDNEDNLSVLEPNILRLAPFQLAQKLLFLLDLRRQLSGSNSVGRMPASCWLFCFQLDARRAVLFAVRPNS